LYTAVRHGDQLFIIRIFAEWSYHIVTRDISVIWFSQQEIPGFGV